MQPSRIISSNQHDVHPDLERLVSKHLQTPFHKPISELNKEAFVLANDLYKRHQGNFILDSGCGVGESSYHIAKLYPDAFVLGVDQSEHRLQINSEWDLPDNAQLIQANLIDFWRLAVESNWLVKHHFLLYPNPWPKKKHLQRRWHGHAVFPFLKELGGTLELRTNWKIYADEFKTALSLLSKNECYFEQFEPLNPITPFERKYQLSNQKLYRVTLSF
ncbi:MAG: SAM-dependent methyltransferase [Gammaproteobacteria bacterium]|nr:MAG: SAM-dependent methyltransferase [Gammaproteobacteria bacterium]